MWIFLKSIFSILFCVVLSASAKVLVEGDLEALIERNDQGQITQVQQDGSCWSYIYDENRFLQAVFLNEVELLKYERNVDGYDLKISSSKFVYWFKKEGQKYEYGDLITGESGFFLLDSFGRRTYEKFMNGASLSIEYLANRKKFFVEGFGGFTIQVDEDEKEYTISSSFFEEFTTPIPFVRGEVLKRDGRGNILSTQLGDQLTEYRYDEEDQLLVEIGSGKEIHHAYLGGFVRNSSDNNVCIEVELNPLMYVERVIKGDNKLNCKYDPFGRLISSNLEGAESSSYLYCAMFEIGRIEGGELKEFRLLDPDLEGMEDFPYTAYIYKEGEGFMTETDLFGNITRLIEVKTNQVKEEMKYSAFKEETEQATFFSPWRYRSQRFHPALQLSVFGKRFYDPESGAFISQDPSGYDFSINRIHFCLNNPLKYSDPLGTKIGWQLTRAEKKQFGDIFEFIGTHFPLPLAVGEHLKLLSSDLTGLEPPEPFDVDQVFELARSSDEEEVAIIHVNGIQTAKRIAELMAHNTFSVFQKKNKQNVPLQISCVYLATKGLGRDLIEASLEWINFQTEGTRLLERQIKQKLAQNYKKIILLCHSRGALATSVVSHSFTEEDRKRLEIYSLGGAATIPGVFGCKVVNYISKRDPLPILIDLYGVINKGKYRNANIVYLDMEEGGCKLFDHAFQGATYQRALEEIAEKFFEVYSS
ncbi:MAG: RHS repeat domain-containing protein [Chlamydiia bacterium]